VIHGLDSRKGNSKTSDSQAPAPLVTYDQPGVAYLIVTGTTTAPRAIELVHSLLELVQQVITILTPNAARVIAPRDLSVIPGNRLVESYFDAAILPRPPDGLVLVAPCSFNSLNKLAAGVADNLALSVTAEAIGRGAPVIVAPSLNLPLLRHPRATSSMASLREWGISIVGPVDDGDGPRLAATETLLAEVVRRLAIFTARPSA
jgi:phosphopantothenoylcysteine decarboxylase/phosphopantothenate--cysteine ligase